MSEALALYYGQAALMEAMMIAGPLLGVALVVGTVISVCRLSRKFKKSPWCSCQRSLRCSPFSPFSVVGCSNEPVVRHHDVRTDSRDVRLI